MSDAALNTQHSSLVLRPGQDRVAAYRGGRLAVPAVPGAGKTTCLAYLAAKLLADQPGTRILILTVMNSAVSNFKRKISRFLAERGLPPRGYQVKTLHSLAAMILKERPEYLMINEAFEILDEQQRSDLLRGIVERWLGNNRHRWKSFLDSGHSNEYYETKWRDRLTGAIPEIIKLIKLRGFTPGEQSEIRARLQGAPDGFLNWAFEVLDSYEQRKRREAAVDFDDLILYAYRLLRDDEGVRQRLQERWTHVFEDEAQDSNPLQEKILDLLSAGHGNLVRVGDTNQGIMRFSGTDPDLFRKFCLDHPRQPIEVASRSTVQIMGLANHLVDWVRESYIYQPCRNALEDHQIRGVDPGDPHPNPVLDQFGIHTFLCNGDIRQEEQAAARLVIDLARSDRESTIAVLARQNASLSRIADRLKQERDIEFDFVGGRPADLEDFHRVATIWTVLRFLAEPFDSNRLHAVLDALVQGIGDDADGQLHQFSAGISPEDLLYPTGGELDWSAWAEVLPASLLPRLQKALQQIRGWLEMSHLRVDELVLYLASELGLEGSERDLANNLCAQVNNLLRQHPGYGLFEVVGELGATVRANLRYMAGVLRDFKGYEPRPGVISLATQHKAKGLEWDNVIVVGLAPDLFFEHPAQFNRNEAWYLKEEYRNPPAMARAQLMYLAGEEYPGKSKIRQWADINQISEELRLLYVSLTRARRRLWIGSHNIGFRSRRLPPSKVFQELQRYIEVMSAG
jgi:DNA helicase-2/ATP-dependent DNA helicase PcrA